MIGYIKGRVITKTETNLIIECGDIGYEVFVSINTICDVSIGEDVKLFIYMQVREDAITLFGFLRKEEKSFFEKLISVSGIGAKVAMTILSSGKIEEISSYIAQNNTLALSKIKGIGKKTAERIVVELRDKVEQAFTLENYETFDENLTKDAVTALISLGFSRRESEEAVLKACREGASTIENIIASALKKSMK